MAIYQSSLFLFDTLPPSNVAAPALLYASSTQIDVSFNLNATESHWPPSNFYKLFYKEGHGGVTENDTEIDSGLFDATPAVGSVSTGPILLAETEYTFAIWAYDLYGNKTKSSELYVWTPPLAPAQVNKVHVQDNGNHVPGVDDGYVHDTDPIPAGVSSLWVDYGAITGPDPFQTHFLLHLHHSTGIERLKQISLDGYTSTPDPEEFNVSSYALNGDHYVVAEIWHYDLSGIRGDGQSTAYYVRPYQPSPPTVVNNGTEDSLNVTINPHGSASPYTLYAINETSTGHYVKTDFTLGPDPVWMTKEAWDNLSGGKVTVGGLDSWETYTFRVRAKNAHGDELSDWSV